MSETYYETRDDFIRSLQKVCEYSASSWSSLFTYLDDYWTGGNEQEVEDLLQYYYFPAPQYGL